MSQGPYRVQPSGTQPASLTSASSSTTTQTPPAAGSGGSHASSTSSSARAGSFGRWQVGAGPHEEAASSRSALVQEAKQGSGPVGAGGLPGAAQLHPASATLLDRADLPVFLDGLRSTHRGGHYDALRSALVDYLAHRAGRLAVPADTKATPEDRNLAPALMRLEKGDGGYLERLERALAAYLGRLRIPLLDSRHEPEMEQLLVEVRRALTPHPAGLIVPPSQAELDEPEEGSEAADPSQAGGGDGEADADGLEEAAFRTAGSGASSDDEPSGDDGPVGQAGPLVRSVATWHLSPQAIEALAPAGEAGSDQEPIVQAALQVESDTADAESGQGSSQTPSSPRSQPTRYGSPSTSSDSGRESR